MTSRLPRGELERKVMDVLWEAEEPLPPRDVHVALRAERDLAYTTVMTILVRLWQKGLLVREPVGRTFAYRPVESRDERVASRMREMLAGAGDRAAALTGFVESLPADEVDQLRRIIRRAGSVGEGANGPEGPGGLGGLDGLGGDGPDGPDG